MRNARVLAVGAILTLAACSGGGDGGGGTTEPAVFSSLDVSPASVTVLVGETETLASTARSQTGAAMSGLTVQYQTSDASKATVNGAGVVTGVAAGTATITATGTIGTVVKTKTVNVTITVPGPTAAVTANAQQKFDPPTVAVTPGGIVTWTFAGLEHNVTFDGTAPQGGNIPNTTTGTQSRTFAAAGTYNYHCTIHAGMTGKVLVK